MKPREFRIYVTLFAFAAMAISQFIASAAIAGNCRSTNMHCRYSNHSAKWSNGSSTQTGKY
jgi:hypothetical protein